MPLIPSSLASMASTLDWDARDETAASRLVRSSASSLASMPLIPSSLASMASTLDWDARDETVASRLVSSLASIPVRSLVMTSVNVAVTDLSSSIVTESGLTLPVRSTLQAEKDQPLAGVAVRATSVPSA